VARDEHEIAEGFDACSQPSRDRHLAAPELVVIVLAGPHQHLGLRGHLVYEWRAADREARADLLGNERLADAALAY
jgi:hypothetical protein